MMYAMEMMHFGRTEEAVYRIMNAMRDDALW